MRNKKVKVEFEINTEKISVDFLHKIVERAITDIAPTLITKLDVQVFSYETKEEILESQGWIKILDDQSNIPDNENALYKVYSPKEDLSKYPPVNCYRLAVMTSLGRGSVTHFFPL